MTVSDDSIAQCVRELRDRLGDNDHSLIKTVSRRGYLLNAVVTIAPQTKPLSPSIRRDRIRRKCGSCLSEPAQLRASPKLAAVVSCKCSSTICHSSHVGCLAKSAGRAPYIGECPVSPQPSPNEIDCLSRAAQCRERAERNDASCVKAAYLRQAEVWLYLAGSDQFEEKDMPKAVEQR